MWRKSSYSPDGNNCVEIGAGVGVRDSKSPSAHLPLSPLSWEAFLASAKSDYFGPFQNA
ncbi:DUF397 domain-containing protein [Lentzea sp. NPDC051208]|uniref:DUF397 domain-containing protein n=1 Tax=Lentzea sp. NPDC051208 TaxID=3154642 RepID=UPI003426273A